MMSTEKLSSGASSNLGMRLSQDLPRYHSPGDEQSLSDSYIIGKPLGDGGYGSVYECKHKTTGLERAIKIVPKKSRPMKLRLRLPGDKASSGTVGERATRSSTPTTESPSDEAREFYISKKLDHPNIAKIYECYEDERNVYFVMDHFRGGDLLDAVACKLGCFSEDKAALLTSTILSALNHCHDQKRLVHMDLKLDNICFPTEAFQLNTVQLIDFGLARELEYSTDSHGMQVERPMTECIGSTAYMSPQVLQGVFGSYPKASYDGRKQDIWSLGVILFMVMSGFPPFAGKSDRELVAAIMDHDERTLFHKNISFWATITDEAKGFLTWILSYDEAKRPTVGQALRHPWITRIRNKYQYAMQARIRESRLFGESIRNAANNLILHASSASQPCILKRVTCALLITQQCGADRYDGAEREAINALFRTLNVRSDGVLTRDEVKVGLRRFLQPEEYVNEVETTEELVDVMFRRLGPIHTNSQDYPAISYSSFVFAATDERSLLDNDVRLRFAFDIFSNGAGLITLKTLKSAVGECLGDEFVDSMFREANLDGTGIISYPDFKNLMVSGSLSLSSSVKTTTSPSLWLAAGSYARTCFSMLRKSVAQSCASHSKKRGLQLAHVPSNKSLSRKKHKQSDSWGERVPSLARNSSHMAFASSGDDDSISSSTIETDH